MKPWWENPTVPAEKSVSKLLTHSGSNLVLKGESGVICQPRTFARQQKIYYQVSYSLQANNRVPCHWVKKRDWQHVGELQWAKADAFAQKHDDRQVWCHRD
ncbi:MAG: hypothetical protein JWL77_2431 [Chthonomonadaceae bacterium]|nr:hypothetical protein [Chthonomonadaceae bacterium]